MQLNYDKQIAVLPCFLRMARLPVLHWFDRNTVKHLRFPFSFFLLPVFLFALSQVSEVNWNKAIIVFVILHFMVFPSSNGYNSYQDRDNTSIGGLKHPPKVTRNLFYVTLLFDLLALIIALFISPLFCFMVFVFIVMSRLYSFRGIRIKKYPVAAFFTVFVFQGAFVYLMTLVAVLPEPATLKFTGGQIICMLISSLFIGSMYPLTQIYQHDADRKDGVMSISCLLGFRGTFVFAGILFAAASILLFYYFGNSKQYFALVLFPVLVLPVVVFLIRWFGKVIRNSMHANFENTMKANMLSATCMNVFFLIVIVGNRLI